MAKRIPILYLSLLLYKLAAGQVGSSVFSRWYIDKPGTKQDSMAIIRSGFTKINVYEAYIDDSAHYDKSLCSSWVLSIVDGRIVSSVALKETHDAFEIITRQVLKKHRLVEYLADSASGYRLTHYMDAGGQVMSTENKFVGKMRYEDRHNRFGPIVYTYKNGLLTEANYFGDGGFVIKGFNYFKFIFEYEK